MDSVVHFEIPADDVERARKFYKTVFGWKLTPAPGMEEYIMAHTVDVDEKTRMPKEPGAINGGMMKRTAKVKTPVVYMMVDSIDASVEKVKKNGGSVVVPKQEVMKMGWSSYVKDSEGNVIGIFQAAKR